jgi:hypothetical protein
MKRISPFPITNGAQEQVFDMNLIDAANNKTSAELEELLKAF